MAVSTVMVMTDRFVAAPGLIGIDIDRDQVLVRLSGRLTQDLIQGGGMLRFMRRFGPGMSDQRR